MLIGCDVILEARRYDITSSTAFDTGHREQQSGGGVSQSKHTWLGKGEISMEEGVLES